MFFFFEILYISFFPFLSVSLLLFHIVTAYNKLRERGEREEREKREKRRD